MIHKATITGRRLTTAGVRDDYNKDVPVSQCLEVSTKTKSGTITTVAKDVVITELPPGRYPHAYDEPLRSKWRYASPEELEALQGFDKGYTEGHTAHTRVRLIGNAWTLPVIENILSNAYGATAMSKDHKGITTLSLFNGIGIGAQALKNIGIPVAKAYISEIDKYANETNMRHHPHSVQLGDVTKWTEWDIDWSSIDLVTAGFPCQAWSLAGAQLGAKDPRGALFWTTLDIIETVLHHNPKAKWFMENVKMKKAFEAYITHHTTEMLGYVEKTLINSALVTAQNRERWYWSNFEVDQPADRGLVLADILERYPDKRFIVNPDVIGRFAQPNGDPKGLRPAEGKSNCVTASVHKGYGNDSCTIVACDKDGLFMLRPCTPTGRTTGHVADAADVRGHDQTRRVYSADGKAPTVTTMGGGHREPKVYLGEIEGQAYYRKITPLECERLQGFPDDYTKGHSNTQRYKQVGNAWTLPVIEQLLTSADLEADLPIEAMLEALEDHYNE